MKNWDTKSPLSLLGRMSWDWAPAKWPLIKDVCRLGSIFHFRVPSQFLLSNKKMGHQVSPLWLLGCTSWDWAPASDL